MGIVRKLINEIRFANYFERIALLKEANVLIFDPEYYLECNPDVAAAGFDPHAHYAKFGWKERRETSHFFKRESYVCVFSEIEKDPVFDCLLNKRLEIFVTTILLDKEYYCKVYKDVREAGIDPVKHFIEYGRHEGRNPSSTFSTFDYVEANRLSLGDENPLVHFLLKSYGNHRTHGAKSASPKEVVPKDNYVENLTTHHSGEYLAVNDDYLKTDRPSIVLVLYCSETELSEYQKDLCRRYREIKNTNLILVLNQEQPVKPECMCVPSGASAILARPNLGFDFGGWSDAFRFFDFLDESPRILLVNDSIAPCREGFEVFIETHLKSERSWLFSTESVEVNRHGQSFCMSLAPKKIDHSVAKILAIDPNATSKQDVIDTKELLLLSDLERMGVDVGFVFETTDYPLDVNQLNPTTKAPFELIDKSFGFLKVELIKDYVLHSNDLNRIIQCLGASFYVKVVEHLSRRYDTQLGSDKIGAGIPQQSVSGIAKRRGKKIVLWGHNANVGGAQILLLQLARTLKYVFGFQVVIILTGGGDNLPKYEEVARCFVVSTDGLNLDELLKGLRAQCFEDCIVNTVIPLEHFSLLQKYEFKSVGLVHELPEMIDLLGYNKICRDVFEALDSVVFPAKNVQSKLQEHFECEYQNALIFPQGHFRISREWKETEDDKSVLADYDLSILANRKVVLSVATAEMRKGYDTFIEAARETASLNEDFLFVWIGPRGNDPLPDASEHGDPTPKNVRHLQFVDPEHLPAFYRRSSVYLFFSRTDPNPYAVIDAFYHGVPVVGFKNVGGLDGAMAEFGYLLNNRDNLKEIYETICLAAKTKEAGSPIIRAGTRWVKESFDFDDYTAKILSALGYYVPKILIGVPNFEHELYLPQRLLSIYNQKYKYYDVLLLDDCSKDNSRELLDEFADGFDNCTTKLYNDVNSGNSYLQWRKIFDAALEYDLVWIAESDDFCDRDFLMNNARCFEDPKVAIAYSNTVFVDNSSNVTGDIAEDFEPINPYFWHRSYVSDGMHEIARCLSHSNTIINVSSVLFRVNAIRSNYEILNEYRFAGDWALYIHLLSAPGAKCAFVAEVNNYFRRETGQTSQFAYSSNFYEEHKKIGLYISERTNKKYDDNVKDLIRKHWSCKRPNNASLEDYLW